MHSCIQKKGSFRLSRRLCSSCPHWGSSNLHQASGSVCIPARPVPQLRFYLSECFADVCWCVLLTVLFCKAMCVVVCILSFVVLLIAWHALTQHLQLGVWLAVVQGRQPYIAQTSMSHQNTNTGVDMIICLGQTLSRIPISLLWQEQVQDMIAGVHLNLAFEYRSRIPGIWGIYVSQTLVEHDSRAGGQKNIIHKESL